MPRYEYTEGTSSKFWEIEVAGAAYTVKWGKIGGSVSSSTKKYGDAAAAKKESDKLVKEKLGKGYKLVGGKAAAKDKPAAKPAPGPKSNADLEKAILADPDDADPYLVYADWMQANGEIRGELVVLQHTNKTKEANALIKKHGEWFLGELGKTKSPVFELEWFCGYIKSAQIGWEPFEDYHSDIEDEREVCEKQLLAFLKHPSARFLRELRIGPIPVEERMTLDGCATVIEEIKPPCLRKLYLGDIDRWNISNTDTAMPDSKAIRGLRELTLRGGDVSIPKIDLPELVSFTVESGGLTDNNLKTIANAKWPRLERLEIWCGDPEFGASGGVKELAPIFAGKGLESLKHLGIRNCPFADEVVKTLIKSKILRQLETLDLSMGNLSDRGVDLMVASKDAFAHLAHLELDDNALTEASKPKLKGLAKKANYGKEQDPDRAVPRNEESRWSRYVSVGE